MSREGENRYRDDYNTVDQTTAGHYSFPSPPSHPCERRPLIAASATPGENRVVLGEPYSARTIEMACSFADVRGRAFDPEIAVASPLSSSER